jgi:RHS repeat-associated protein
MNKPLLSAILLLTMLLHAAAQVNVENSDIYTGRAEIIATTQVRLLPGFRAVEGCNVRVYIDPSASYTPVVYNPTPGGMPGTVSASSSKNYIRTTALRQEQTNEANIGTSPRTETVDYYDGLGRPVQSIAVQASPLKKDIVQALAYDGFGRDSIHYLPYMAGTTTGAYVSNPETGCTNFYSGTVPGREPGTSPWNETLYESSPLNRVTGEKGPDDWQTKPTVVSYSTNASTTTGVIQHWNADKTSFYYNDGELYVTTYTDEDGHQTREYKDKLGRVVRKEAHDGTGWLRTAYVYDDFGQLVIVVPPKASNPDTDTELCYYYEYDKRRRMIKKDLPGASSVYMVYDKRDRLVMIQDGKLRGENGGTLIATIYDKLNRPVITAKVIAGINPTTVQGNFDNFAGEATHSSSGAVLGYITTFALPGAYSLSENNIQTVTYYDKYEFLQAADFSSEEYGFTYYSLAGFATPETAKRKGLATGTLTRVIENANDLISDNLLLSVNYYDDFGRPIRVVTDNHMGKKDVIYTNYNFAGEITETTTIHNHGLSNQVKLATAYGYDHQGRLLTEKIEIDDSGAPVTLASYEYNELGEQIAKYLHGNSSGSDFNQKVDYTYNIKGWLRKQNQTASLGTDLFAQELKYQESGNPSSYFNGNIWQTSWKNTGDITKSYTFSYDEVNRLNTAAYSDGVSDGNFDTNYSFDANGNILTLSRKAIGNPIDVLTYSYLNSGNKLQSVTDAGTTEGYHAVAGNYVYDLNGNMTTDPSKGTTIDYNYLNLPSQVQFGANDNLRYTYDAAGNKLVKVVDGTVAENNTRLDYSGNFLYENNELKAIFTSVGRIVPFDNGGETIFKFEYNLQDHLGNTRVVFSGHSNGQPEVMQVTDYYPFGLVMNQENYFASGVLFNKYLYNNKEWQDDELAGNSLGWYDYGARLYDPELGRWHTIDPLAENYSSTSPYAYVLNSPVNAIDPNGMSTDWVEKENGEVYWDENATSQSTTKEGETYLGKNVLVGTHNRDADGNEPINSATFDLYLESDKTGASATIKGNTVPADPETQGTLAEGLYQAKSDHRSKYPNESALRILNLDGTDGLPTVNGNPNPESDGRTLTGIFFHSASNSYESLFWYNANGTVGGPWTTGCQTSGSGPGRKALHDAFMIKVGNFNGTYYLRGNK